MFTNPIVSLSLFFFYYDFWGSIHYVFHWWVKHLLQIILIFFFVFVTLLQLASFEGSMASHIHHHAGLKWHVYPPFIEFLACQTLCMFSPKRIFRNPRLSKWGNWSLEGLNNLFRQQALGFTWQSLPPSELSPMLHQEEIKEARFT